jgi:hypothetical protein
VLLAQRKKKNETGPTVKNKRKINLGPVKQSAVGPTVKEKKITWANSQRKERKEKLKSAWA